MDNNFNNADNIAGSNGENTANPNPANDCGYDYYNYNTQALQQGMANIGSPIVEESHRVRGIIGAILGALVGCIAWVLVGFLGYIAAPIAFLIYFLAIAGYKKFGKKEDIFGYVLGGVLVLVMVSLGTYLYTGLWLTKELNGIGKEVDVARVFGNFKWFLHKYDVWGSFIKNLVMGYVFAIVAVIGTIIGQISEAKKNKK